MGKQRLTISVLLGLIFACSGLVGAPVRAGNATLETAIVVDPLNGVTLGGYDAVSYFTDGAPLPGRPEFDFYWHGVPWYFSSAANRDAFARAPEVYAPLFGGHGVMSLSRGYLSAGNPRLFLIMAGRLFLFHSQGNRDAFLGAPRDAYKAAEQQWTVLLPTLTRSAH